MMHEEPLHGTYNLKHRNMKMESSHDTQKETCVNFTSEGLLHTEADPVRDRDTRQAQDSTEGSSLSKSDEFCEGESNVGHRTTATPSG